VRNLLNMELHDVVTISNSSNGKDIDILRVPGGWIYNFYEEASVQSIDGMWQDEYRQTSVFVPFTAKM